MATYRAEGIPAFLYSGYNLLNKLDKYDSVFFGTINAYSTNIFIKKANFHETFFKVLKYTLIKQDDQELSYEYQREGYFNKYREGKACL